MQNGSAEPIRRREIRKKWLDTSLLVLYVINAFFFLLLSFFFLPDALVKILGSAAGVAFGVIGVKSLNPREASGHSPIRFHRKLFAGVLFLTAIVQGVLLIFGYIYPCYISAIPGSTIMVDGKFLARTESKPDEQSNYAFRATPSPASRTKTTLVSPDNISPWLKAKPHGYYLRWDKHEIKISKKWYADGRDRSQESVKEVSVKLSKLWEFWRPWEVFNEEDWSMETEQKPFFRISYGFPGHGPPNTELGKAVKSVVDKWDGYWTTAMGLKDVIAYQRIEPYVVSLEVVQDPLTQHVDLQTLDWDNHTLKALQPYPVAVLSDTKVDELGTTLTSIRKHVFEQLLAELAIGETINLPPGKDELAADTATLNLQVDAVPTATSTPAAIPDQPPFSTVSKLQDLATNAAQNDQLDVAIAARQQLQTALDKVQPQSALAHQIEQSTNEIKQAIQNKTSKGRIYIYIANESQREPARKVKGPLWQKGFAVIGIQNVGGRALVPEAAEVRYFLDNDTAKDAAKEIVTILKPEAGNVRLKYRDPSPRDKKQSIDINTHFEIWLASDSFANSRS